MRGTIGVMFKPLILYYLPVERHNSATGETRTGELGPYCVNLKGSAHVEPSPEEVTAYVVKMHGVPPLRTEKVEGELKWNKVLGR